MSVKPTGGKCFAAIKRFDANTDIIANYMTPTILYLGSVQLARAQVLFSQGSQQFMIIIHALGHFLVVGSDKGMERVAMNH